MKRTSSVLTPVCLQMEVAATVTVSLMLASPYTINDDCKIDNNRPSSIMSYVDVFSS